MQNKEELIEDPLVSVRVITYNHGKFIRECLEGIFMQKTNFPFEVIIGEDCSKDNTKIICEEFKARYPKEINLLSSNKNLGAAQNAKKIRAVTRGNYIALCEGDDYWVDPLKLQKQVDFLEANPDYVLCFHRINIVSEDGTLMAQRKSSDEIVLYTWRDLFHISIPPLSVVFRNCIKEYPSESFSVLNGDKFLFGMLSTYGAAAELGFVGGCYRKHRGGAFSAKNFFQKWRSSIYTRKMMKKVLFLITNRKKKLSVK